MRLLAIFKWPHLRRTEMTVFIPAVSLSFSQLVEKPLTLLCASSLETILFLGWSLLAKCEIERTLINTSFQVPIGGILKFVIITDKSAKLL